MKDLSREVRAMRWIATPVIPEVYAALMADEKKWAASSDAAHFLAGIESSAISSLVDPCRALSAEGNTGNLLHLSLQFDGAEILLNRIPRIPNLLRMPQ